MSAELFIGNLSPEVRLRDLENCFFRYGRILRCDLKKNFGFIEFEDRRAAEEAIRKENGRRLMGSEMNIEWAKGSIGDKARRGNAGFRRPPSPSQRGPPRFRDRSPRDYRPGTSRDESFPRRDSFRGERDGFRGGRRGFDEPRMGRRDSFGDSRRSFGGGPGSFANGFDDRRPPMGRFDERRDGGRGDRGRRF